MEMTRYESKSLRRKGERQRQARSTDAQCAQCLTAHVACRVPEPAPSRVTEVQAGRKCERLLSRSRSCRDEEAARPSG